MVNRLDIIKDEAFERIYKVDVFDKEYKKMFGKSKQVYRAELEQLAVNLTILDESTKADALQRQQFEVIKQHAPLCAIRHVSRSNPRVIYVYTEQENAIVLLACGLEQATEKNYKEIIFRAEQRLHLLEEEEP